VEYISTDKDFKPGDLDLVCLLMAPVDNLNEKSVTAGFIAKGVWYAAESPTAGFTRVSDSVKVLGWQPLPPAGN
jgi:hypothetical protein